MSWTTRTATGIRNVHERLTPGKPAAAAELLETIAEPGNPLWPSDRWPPLVLDNGLEPGSDGGHGPVRYHVTDHRPGRSISFAFDPAGGIRGGHTFSIEAVDDGRASEATDSAAADAGRVRWRHELVIERPSALVRTTIVPLHDALLEDLLDGADAALCAVALRRPPFSRGTRARLWLLDRVGSRAQPSQPAGAGPAAGRG